MSLGLATVRLGAILLGAVLLGACADEPSRDGTVVVDLVAEQPHARSDFARARLRLADPAVRPRLLHGWSRNAGGDGAFVWALGPRAGVEIFVDRVADLTLRLRCAGAPLPPGEPPQLTLSISGEAVASRPLPEPGATAAMEFRVPAARLELGVNRVDFELSRWHDPAHPADGIVDDRPLGARCEALEIEGAARSAGPPRRAEADGRQTLVLPAGSGVRYFLEPPAGARLVLGDIERHGAALAVRVVDEAGRVVVDDIVRGGGSWPLGDASARLRLDLVASPAQGPLGGVFGAPDAPRVVLGEAAVRADTPFDARTAAHAEDGAREDGAPEDGAVRAADGQESVDEAGRVAGVLVYLVDTVRADHLSLYGYPRPTSPELERLAEEAITFTEARAQTSWTRTAVASIFTGRLPSAHGVDDRDDVLSDELPTLAEAFADAGWATAGVTTNGNAGPRFGFGQGFDAYQHMRESRRRREVHRLADDVGAWILTWLDAHLAQDDPAPFFLYAHATDPHAPYTPRPPFDQRFAPGVDPVLGELASVREITDGLRTVTPAERDGLVDLYDGEIAFVDQEIGRLVDALRARGVFDDLLLVIVSDHGEEFLDHGGWEHGKTLYEEQLRVPLVIKLPGGEGAGLRLSGRADHVDILPTVLDAVGLASPPGIDGLSLLPAVRHAAVGGTSGARWPSIAELRLAEGEQLSLVDGAEKLIVEHGVLGPDGVAHGSRLFDLESDPRELDDHGEEAPFAVGVLEERLRRHLGDAASRRPRPVETELDDETREQLEALGYVQ